MAISTTGRRPLCIFCSVSVLSKMLKLRSAEGSSFRLWWMLSAFLLLRHRHCALHQTHWWLGSIRLFLRQMPDRYCWVFWDEALSEGELAVARTVCFCVSWSNSQVVVWWSHFWSFICVDEVRCLFLRLHHRLWSIRCLFLRWIIFGFWPIRYYLR